jgi:hypothetical protein
MALHMSAVLGRPYILTNAETSTVETSAAIGKRVNR